MKKILVSKSHGRVRKYVNSLTVLPRKRLCHPVIVQRSLLQGPIPIRPFLFQFSAHGLDCLRSLPGAFAHWKAFLKPDGLAVIG